MKALLVANIGLKSVVPCVHWVASILNAEIYAVARKPRTLEGYMFELKVCD